MEPNITVGNVRYKHSLNRRKWKSLVVILKFQTTILTMAVCGYQKWKIYGHTGCGGQLSCSLSIGLPNTNKSQCTGNIPKMFNYCCRKEGKKYDNIR